MNEEAKERPLDPRLSHLRGTSAAAEARMVDVGHKPASSRSALARARMRFPTGVLATLLAGAGPKGAVGEVARIAGVLGAKRTPSLIPLCHGLALDHVEVELEQVGEDLLELRCRTSCHGATGVEMESLVGVVLAALTVYDMGKGLDKGIRIESVELLEKTGGKSGAWRRAPESGQGEGATR